MDIDTTFNDVQADLDVHVDAAQGRRQRARWAVIGGLIIWMAGTGLWELTWAGGLAATTLGGALLIDGLSTLARGPDGANASTWAVVVPVAISMVLISRGLSLGDFGARVVAVGLGTLGMMLVFLRILDDRVAMERQLAAHTLADERRRLAGDVHDVVGHTLSASMLHTSAARLAVRSDPDAAIASLERAEQQGRRSMEDIRSVVRLLRDDSGVNPPTSSVGDLPELVENFRAGGADIVYSAAGDLIDVPAPVALTVYRVVQEGLTNAVRHGTGTIDVAVRIEAAVVDVKIANDVPARRSSTSPGSGLAGMRERVEAIGGTLEVTDSNRDDRWVLAARIPK